MRIITIALFLRALAVAEMWGQPLSFNICHPRIVKGKSGDATSPLPDQLSMEGAKTNG
jgi:hypothetical protein